MNERTERWLVFAREDLRMAELALDAMLWNQVCFHGQQCVEKLLKAWIAVRGETPPRTHSLSDLVALLGDARFVGLADEVRALDRFYIPTRYPDVLPDTYGDSLPGASEARDTLALAKHLMALDILS